MRLDKSNGRRRSQMDREPGVTDRGTLYTNATCIECVNRDEEFPETLPDPVTGAPVLGIAYVRTDQWRGFYEPFALPGCGWCELKDEGGWVTGDWDDAPPRARASNVQARVERRWPRTGTCW